MPPNDAGAEAAVIAACLLEPGTIDEVLPLLETEHFYVDQHKIVYDAIRGLRERGLPVDVVTVAGWIRDRDLVQRAGGPERLGELLDATPAVANVSAHAAIVKEKWRLRRLISVCHTYAARGYTHQGEAREIFDELESEVLAISNDSTTDGMVTMREVVEGAIKQVVKAAETGNGVTGIATGYRDLDKKTAGLHRGDLLIIAARPGMAKTALAFNIAVNVAKDGHGVAVFELEMPKEQVGQRTISTEARHDLARMRSGSVFEKDWSDLTGASVELSQLPILVDDTPGLAILEIRSKARRAASRLAKQCVKLGVVIVDYIQLASGSGKNGNREQEISEISRGLKRLAKELGVAVIALSQLNRDCEKRTDKRPMLSDIRESGGIEQDADCVVFIFRPEYYEKDSPDRGIAELIIAKQRNGPTGTVRVRFVSSCTRFESLAPGEAMELEERE